MSLDVSLADAEFYDSHSNSELYSNLSDDSIDEDEPVDRLPESNDSWVPPPALTRQNSRLRWQTVPPRKPLPSAYQAHLTRHQSLKPSRSALDPDLVTWNGKDDPQNPLNWTKRKKWTSTILVSCFTFISPVASTMVAPALPAIAEQFNIESDVERMLVMSIFLLAYAVGPFVLAPLSEIFGRVVVLQSANLVYLIFNTACGFAQTKEQMMAFRFLSGLGGSAPQAIGGGVLSDCWTKDERGSAIALYSLMPFIGPAVGPIAGGYITLHTTWRWIFWSTSIADVLIQILAFGYLDETYHPAILKKICQRKWLETGNDKLHTKWQTPDKTFAQIFRKAMIRPFLMLVTQPALQAMALYRAYGYGVMYLVLSTFPMVFQEQYDQDIGTASLHYISLGIGFVVGLQISGRMQDKTYRYLKANAIDPCTPMPSLIRSLVSRHGPTRYRDQEQHNPSDIYAPSTPLQPKSSVGAMAVFPPPPRAYTTNSDPSTGLPEHRLPLCLPFGLLVPLGLLIYGLCAAAKTHWFLPDMGACVFCIGLIVTFNCAQAYVVDTYTNEVEGVNFAASATGAAAFVRTMAGFTFPLFAPNLYASLGVGGGNGLLAAVALVVGVIAPVALWRFGVVLRRFGYGRL
jgi:MFS family permease